MILSIFKKSFILFILLFAFSCDKKKKQQLAQHPVPNIPVNVTVYPNDPLYFKLQAIGGWMYIDGGLNGIVLYRKSQEEFVALERTSSYLPDDPNARVSVMNDNFTLRDSVSDSRWQMFDGSISKGPAEWPLRLYGTSYNGNRLRVFN